MSRFDYDGRLIVDYDIEIDFSQWPDKCPYCYRELDDEHYNDACMRQSCPSGTTEIHRCFTCGLERITYEGQAKEHKCKCVEVKE